MCHNSMLPCGMFLLVHGLNGENFGIMVKYGRESQKGKGRVRIVNGSLWDSL
jgi:hypothetical protein